MDQNLFLLAVHLRLMNLAYHNAHNLVSGEAFFSDHGAFGSFYEEVDDDYDSVVERAIGMGFRDVANLKLQLHYLDSHISVLPDVVDWKIAKALEIHLRSLCDAVDKDPSCTPGLRELVGGIADRSDVRTYKVNQRLGR